MTLKKILFSLLAVAVATAVTGVWIVSCSPAPQQGGDGGGQEQHDPGTLLMENTSSAAPNYLRAIYYKKTDTAHVFSLKTSFRGENLVELNNYVHNIVGNNLWGLVIIGIDRNSVDSPDNVIRLNPNAIIVTADPSFEFDALIRINGDNNPITSDSIPLRPVEADTIYLEFIDPATTAQNATNRYFWENRASEKKFQGGAGDEASAFITGAYVQYVLDNNRVTNRVDARAIKYVQGYYVFTIPFSVIGENDIKKITVFGLQNKDWRAASTDAAIKPLGSDRITVEASNGVIGKLPVLVMSNRAIIQGEFGDVSYVLLNPSSIDISGIADSTNIQVQVTVLSTISQENLPLSISGPKGAGTYAQSATVRYEGRDSGTGLHKYTNTISLSVGKNSGDVYSLDNYEVSFESTNNSVNKLSVSVTMIKIDGNANEPEWQSALSINDPANDNINHTSVDITNIRITNDLIYLYVLVMYRTASGFGGQENPRNVIFISTNDTTGTNIPNSVPDFDWVTDNQTNDVKFDLFIVHNGNGWGVLADAGGTKIENWSNNPQNWRAAPSIINNPRVVEYRIRLSSLNLSANTPIKVGVSVVNPGQSPKGVEAVHDTTSGYQRIGMYEYTIR